jgi:hypothetical protein
MKEPRTAQVNLSRRRAIARFGVFAAYAAPTLTTLLVGRRAHAQGGGNSCDHHGKGVPPFCSMGAADSPETTRTFRA